MKLKTDTVPVRLFTADLAVEGNAHVRPGSYAGRISDVLNRSKVAFLPVTDARYRLNDASASGEFVESACVLVNVNEIVLVDVLGE